MDKNTIIGITLIVVIMIVFTILNQPSKEEVAAMKRKQDSIAQVDSMKKVLEAEQAAAPINTNQMVAETEELTDSARAERAKSAYGAFAASADGEQEFITLENEKFIVKLTTKGGRVYSVRLKDYQTYDSLPLVLFDGDTNKFNLTFSHENRNINTADLYFQPTGGAINVSGNDSASISMRAMADNGGYIEYVYKLYGSKYLVDYKINFVGLNGVLDNTSDNIKIDWAARMPRQEKSLQNERMATSIHYKVLGDDVDNLSESGEERDDEVEEKTNWIAFKQQFFASVLISNNGFEPGAKLKTTYKEDKENYVKDAEAHFALPFQASDNVSYDLALFYGPTHYQTLRKYKLDLEDMLPLGWGIFGWINKYAVIPVFNFLDGFNLGYGLIILILTILLKLVLLPIAYKSYMSSAKMKVLKPEIAELNKQYEGKDAMEKQQATMALYRKAGVNPLAGCIPALLQMPILIAMFRFFPASIELRQQSFLWADDLSSYDSILDLPFTIPFYGDHVSLFTLLMTVTTIIYTRMNSNMMGGGNDAMAAQMKWMMYLMPIMFLGFFNSYASGLSYYYFLANIITFSQQFIFTKLIDEDAIHAKIEANKKKPKKESAFQKRLEEMAKQQGYKVPRSERRKGEK